MDNLPSELQYRLTQLEWCIKNQFHQSSLLALDELTNLLSTDYQQFQKAYQILQQVSTPTQTRQTNPLPFPSSGETPLGFPEQGNAHQESKPTQTLNHKGFRPINSD